MNAAADKVKRLLEPLFNLALRGTCQYWDLHELAEVHQSCFVHLLTVPLPDQDLAWKQSPLYVGLPLSL